MYLRPKSHLLGRMVHHSYFHQTKAKEHFHKIIVSQLRIFPKLSHHESSNEPKVRCVVDVREFVTFLLLVLRI